MNVPWGWKECAVACVFALAVIVGLNLTLGTLASASPSTSLAVAAFGRALAVGGLLIITAWYLSLRRFRLGLSAWGFCRPNRSTLWVVPTALAANYVLLLMTTALLDVRRYSDDTPYPHTLTGAMLFVGAALAIAPAAEEIFFRGFLFEGLGGSWGTVWGGTLSSAAFAAGHLNVGQFVPLFIAGLLSCWVFRRTGSLWSSIAFHAANNGIYVALWALTR